ncbi:restriction endonuclease subunit S [Crossiella sp. CA-258035]|uniref:restriction endonuclease subunit S n=1 Tax=Crossiella sp. CA-258035 TaxID=2981138 RepID=UPI0024BBF3D6|nr:restriction endonuclease subunit S [Crossiella sp. CA-258035]WHT20673.1 restriction endonuclease subunit S [Crossiella sp. CA-258035]
MTDSVRLKWLLTESDVRAGAEAEALPLLSVSISWGVRRREASDMTTRAASEDLSSYKLCRAGDLVINRMRAFQGALGIAPEDGVVSPDYAVLRVAPMVDKRWLNYFLTSGFTVATMASLVRGIGGTEAGNVRTPRLNISDLQSMTAPLVSADEQRAIADYLDRETARIDTLVEEQQRLIEMLRERRHALRVHVALHGTTQAAEADSPLPWASKLPASWRVVPLTSAAQLESGHTPSRSREDWWTDCYIPWVSLHDVGTMRGAKYLQDTAQRISDAGIANSSARLLPVRTVVLSRDATVGRTAIMGVPMATSQHFAAWVCGPLLDPEYLWVLFSDAMQPFFDSFQNGSTIRTIGMGDLKAFRIPLPPLGEQRRIVEYLDEETPKIDTVIAETERFIELARERRAALITAAVTGQIDVREMV